MDMMRHVAKVSNTDQRCVVAFMQIPDRPDHALICPTDNLPPRYEQAVMEVLKSAEGQNEEIFAVALSRRLMPDTGKDILTTLHENGLLQAVETSRILMMPRPNQPVKLTDILQQLGRVPGDPSHEELDKFNPHTNNLRAGDSEQRRAIAQNLLLEAQMLENDAKKKREKAYSYDASLKPREVGPQTVVATASSDDLSLDDLLAESDEEPAPVNNYTPDC
jgi:hypothetical protein